MRETICTLVAEGYKTIIQSTLPLSGFKDMPQCYDDMRSLYALIRRIQPDFKMQYNPALTYLSPLEASQKDLDVMRDSLLDIAKKDLSFYDEEKNLFFGWFSKRKMICAAGESLYTVDLDGDVYACHGALYHDRRSHKVTSIFSNDFESYLVLARDGFKSAVVPDECRNCNVDYCTRCQAMAYSLSQKQSYLERWYDFPAKSMCSIYQINHNINQALRAVIRGS